MALSFSPAARRQLKDALTCFSVANLCFLRRWYDLEHLKERSMDYYRTAPATQNLLWATLMAATLLAGVLWLAWRWVEQNPTAARWKLAQIGFLLLLIRSLESVRRYWNDELGRTDLGSTLAILTVEAVLGTGLVMVLFGNSRILRAAHRVALMLALLLPALVIDFTVSQVSAETAAAFAPKPSIPFLPRRPGDRRVIWMVFDEFDQRLAFDARQASVSLPELDRFRAESLVSDHANETARWTILALPSLLSGRVYARAELKSAGVLRVYPEGSDWGFDWRDQPNIFKEARALGANPELVGWHHPYCRILGDSLVRCLDIPGGHPTAGLLPEQIATHEGVLRMVGFLFHMQLADTAALLGVRWTSSAERLGGEFIQRRMQQQYFLIRDRAYAAAADPRIDFLFAHFPTPHPFPIYDRRKQNFALSSSLDYLDNLALVDRTVGEMRRVLERAGLWESTSIVITADHALRPELWRGRYTWTSELEQLTEGPQSETVPFIVRLAGRGDPRLYDRPFSNVLTGELSLAILRGQVTTTAQASSWLDGHAGGAGPGRTPLRSETFNGAAAKNGEPGGISTQSVR